MSSSFTVDHLLSQDLNASGDLLLNNASTGSVVVGSRLQVGLNGSAYTLPSSRGENDQVLTASGDQVVWADAQGGGGGGGSGTLIQNPQGSSIVTCAVPSTITGSVDSVDRLVCDAEKFVIASPSLANRIEFRDLPQLLPDTMVVAAPLPPFINMYCQDVSVFSIGENGTRLTDPTGITLSDQSENFNLIVASSGVQVNGYKLPPSIGNNGDVLTCQSNIQLQWLPPAVKRSFAVSFGGVIKQNGYFVLNGIGSTPTSTTVSPSATFISPIACSITNLSYNTNISGLFPFNTKVQIQNLSTTVVADVVMFPSFDSSVPLNLILNANSKVALQFLCPDPTIDTPQYEATFTCLFQQF